MPVVNVNLNRRRYPVIIGSDVLNKSALTLSRHVTDGRLFVFYDAQVYALHGHRVRTLPKRWRLKAGELVVPVGEKSKSQTELSKIYGFLFEQKISRTDFILACGGGVTSDLVGYAAATTLRGVRWGIVSTTLLGMVDAAIGGKTGINHPRGKNLVGAFWQPSFVLCDTTFLKTLPARELIAGLGEVVKYGGLIGSKLLIVIDEYLSKGDLSNDRLLSRMIQLSATYKADLVAQDERDTGKRMFLNLGHTFAHAIENAVGYGRLLHGEAVILGLLAAVELSCLLKPQRLKSLATYRNTVEQMIRFVQRRAISSEKVLKAMQLDKKRTGARQRFVLLDKPGCPFIANQVSTKLAATALEKTLVIYTSKGGRDAPNLGR